MSQQETVGMPKFWKLFWLWLAASAFAIFCLLAWRATYQICHMYHPRDFSFSDKMERVPPWLDFPLTAPVPVAGKTHYRTATMEWVVNQHDINVKDPVAENNVRTKYGCGGKGGRLLMPLVRELRDDAWIEWSESNPQTSRLFWQAFLDFSRYGEPYDAQDLLLEASDARKNSRSVIDVLDRYEDRLRVVREEVARKRKGESQSN